MSFPWVFMSGEKVLDLLSLLQFGSQQLATGKGMGWSKDMLGSSSAKLRQQPSVTLARLDTMSAMGISTLSLAIILQLGQWRVH